VKYHLHHSIPNWMIKAVVATNCRECDQSIIKDDIVGMGVKEVGKEGKVNIFVEYQCHGCKHAARMNFSSQTASVEEICYLIIDEVQKKWRTQKAQSVDNGNLPKSKMTAAETKKFIKKMNSLENFDDFLKLIGANNLVEKEDINDQPHP